MTGDRRALTAIVLAAGVNRRLGETTAPKPFLSLTGSDDGPSFIDRHVAILTELGVDDVVVVRSDTGIEPPPLDRGRYVVNPFDTTTTGSTLSMLCALRLGDLPADHGLLVMDGDIVYERELMRHVLDACTASTLFVSPAVAGDDEEVRVYGTDGRPALIGKGLEGAMTVGMDLFGESLGVIHVAPSDRDYLRTTCEWLVGWPPERTGYGYSAMRSEHEEVWQYLFAANRLGVASTPPGMLFSECDTLQDYRHVTGALFASITARDAVGAGGAESAMSTGGDRP